MEKNAQRVLLYNSYWHTDSKTTFTTFFNEIKNEEYADSLPILLEYCEEFYDQATEENSILMNAFFDLPKFSSSEQMKNLDIINDTFFNEYVSLLEFDNYDQKTRTYRGINIAVFK